MRKLIERLLVFIIGIPAVTSLVLFLPHYSGLAMNIVVVFFSAMGAVEFSLMLEKKQIRISKVESFIYGALAPLTLTLNVSFGFPEWIVPVFVMATAGWALVSRVFSRPENMESIINHIIGGFSLILYPGFFIYWLIKMNVWEKPGLILLFLLITFASDSVAWLFGTLFGKNNRGIIAVSPNKSIAGFLGGLVGSIIIVIGAFTLFPSLFSSEACSSPLLFSAVILGACTGITAMLGDLAESALKRSCDFKDSGNFMLGRGGVLDSIDSIAVAAPVFFFIFNAFFQC